MRHYTQHIDVVTLFLTLIMDSLLVVLEISGVSSDIAF